MDLQNRFSTIVLVLLLSACSENILSEFADEDTYAALVFEARKELNNRNFAAASTLFETAGGATGTTLLRDDQADYASSYSGQCGLEFINLVDTLGDTTGSTLLNILMGAFPNSSTTLYGHCITAESRLDTNIGTFTDLNGNENLLMAFNSFAKIGAILNTKADNDDNNGIADAGFDNCDATDPGAGDNLTDLEVAHIGSGLARVITSLGQVGGSYADIGDLTAVCAIPAVTPICSMTDTADFGAAEISLIRNLIGSTDYGVGSCGDTFTNCANPIHPNNCP